MVGLTGGGGVEVGRDGLDSARPITLVSIYVSIGYTLNTRRNSKNYKVKIAMQWVELKKLSNKQNS